MSDEQLAHCELWAKNAWQPIDIHLALKMPSGRRMRCVECHGRVRAHSTGSNGMRAHFEHYSRHSGCSRGDCFAGVHSPHPGALR